MILNRKARRLKHAQEVEKLVREYQQDIAHYTFLMGKEKSEVLRGRYENVIEVMLLTLEKLLEDVGAA